MASDRADFTLTYHGIPIAVGYDVDTGEYCAETTYEGTRHAVYAATPQEAFAHLRVELIRLRIVPARLGA